MRADPPGWKADERMLRGTLLDHPWVDPDLPSLVAAGEDGEILGFIGSQPRILRFGDRRLRGVCCSHLVAAADSPSSALGARLLRRLLSSGQDLTWSDSANETVLRMWMAFGGHPDHARACDWMLVLRPARWLGGALKSALRRQRPGRKTTPVGAIPFQALGPRLATRAFPARDAAANGEEATAEGIADALPALVQKGRLQVDHDPATLRHDLDLVRAVLGSLSLRLVRRGGHPIGWYAHVPARNGVGRVLHLDAIPGEEDAVLGELVESARARGGAALSGRMEPNLDRALRRRFAVLGFARRPLLHTRDPELRAALAGGGSLLTRLNGEWWVR